MSERPAAGAAPRVKAVKTRDRILTAALMVFNDHGPGISSADLAAALGLSEGNIWYHFRTREALILALYAMLEERLDRNLATPLGSVHSIESYQAYLVESFRARWDFRFLWRDATEVHATAPVIKARIAERSKRAHDQLVKILRFMANDGLLEIDPRDISVLVINVRLVTVYWIQYLQDQSSAREITHDHIRQGQRQVAALFRPYLPRSDGVKPR